MGRGTRPRCRLSREGTKWTAIAAATQLFGASLVPTWVGVVAGPFALQRALHEEFKPCADQCWTRCSIASRMALLVLVQGLALGLGFYSVLSYNAVLSVAGPPATVVICCSIQALVICGAHMPATAFCRRFPGSPLGFVALPFALAACWGLLGLLSPIGTFGHPAYAVSLQRPFSALASTGGNALVLTALALLSSAGFALAPGPEPGARDRGRRAAAAFLALVTWAAAWEACAGGAFMQPGTAADSAADPLRVTCLTNSDVLRGGEMFARTMEAFCAGSRLVVWSESAVSTRRERSVLLHYAHMLSRDDTPLYDYCGRAKPQPQPNATEGGGNATGAAAATSAAAAAAAALLPLPPGAHNASGGPPGNGTLPPPLPTPQPQPPVDHTRPRPRNFYLALAYTALGVAEGDKGENRLALLELPSSGAPGRVLAVHAKQRLVPLGEAHLRAGTAPFPVVDTDLGRVALSVCFDLDFPLGLLAAGHSRADVMVQSARTWAGMGALHAADSASRALENGFALVRCASDGVSGVWGADGTAASRTPTGTHAIADWSLAAPPRHAWTPFLLGGFLLEPLLVALWLPLAALALAPPPLLAWAARHRWARRLGRVPLLRAALGLRGGGHPLAWLERAERTLPAGASLLDALAAARRCSAYVRARRSLTPDGGSGGSEDGSDSEGGSEGAEAKEEGVELRATDALDCESHAGAAATV